jgi:hypothetical protein
VAELDRACWKLGARPGLGELRLRKWAHMLGFGGHSSTKSRRYSTTLGRCGRPGRLRHPPPRWPHPPVGRVGRPEDEQAVIVVASWSHVGSGYQTKGRRGWLPRRLLGLGEARPIAREELRTRTIAA